MITYRLADSLPVDIAQRLADEAAENGDVKYRLRMEKFLDSGHGCCSLKDPKIAQLNIQAWRHFDGTRYKLLAWVVMPNHVHVIIELLGTASLAQIVQSWKSFTGRRMGAVKWQREYWDRYIRDEEHYCVAITYVRQNPVKAGLCKESHEWPWSSAAEKMQNAELELGGPSRLPPHHVVGS